MPILSVQKLNFRANQQVILENLTFDINKHEIVTLVGPSGSGKSTLLKLIASLLSPTSGVITFQKQDIEQLDPVNYRKKVSYCFQQPSLFGETVQDNLNFPFEIRQQAIVPERIDSYLDMVALNPSFLTKKVTELSGGEKQRVALIRNLLFPPEILLLDEVTTGLDTESKGIVQKLLDQTVKNGTTIIQVTHDESEISKAQRLITIDKGGLLDE